MDYLATIKTASDALQAGDPGRSEQLCRRVLEQEPGNPEALHQLGLVCRARGRPAEAAELIARAVAQEPDNVRYLNSLGIVLRVAGRLEEALAACRKAVGLAPRSAAARNSLGNVLYDLGRTVESEAAFRQALELAPGEPDYLGNLSVCLLGQGRLAEAEQCMRQCLGPGGNANLYHNYGLLLRRLDRHAAAEQAQLQALRIDPAHAPAWLYLAVLRHYRDPDHPDLRAMRELLQREGLSDKDREQLHFALGKALEDCGEYGRAFAHFREGNRIVARRMTWDADASDQQQARIMAIFTRAFIRAHRLEPLDRTPAPLFITGLPRSGKTSLERLLASHPQVHRGGELLALPGRSVHWLLQHWGAFPPAKMEPGPLREAARRYLDFIGRLAPDAACVTDTLPENINHLGFVALLFPGARIIHCSRDPQDTLVSIYCKHYGEREYYSSRPDTIRTRMQQHQRLMEHWRLNLPDPVLEVRYEDLVTRPVETARRAADYCGLTVSPALEAAWQDCGLDDRWIGRAGRFREFLDTAGTG